MRCSAWPWPAAAGPTRAGRRGCTERPTRPWPIWATPSSPFESGLADRDRQRLRAAMGEAFDAEDAAGRRLDPAEVLAEAGRKDTPAVPGRAVGSREAALVLTPRELDVLKLVAQGSSNADIARRLFLSEHTVHRHLANILRKLGLSSRAAAAAWGVRTGLI